MKEYIDLVLKLKPSVTMAHHIPGRIRLKYKASILLKLGSFNKNELSLKQFPAFKSYKLNMATSSILIEYDAAVVPPQIIEELFSESDKATEQACEKLLACLGDTEFNNE